MIATTFGTRSRFFCGPSPDDAEDVRGLSPRSSQYGYSSSGFAYDYLRGMFVEHERPKRKRKVSRKKSAAAREADMRAAMEALAKIAACFDNPHDAVLRFTRDIFDGDIGIENVVDAETGVESTQVKVEATGSVDELLALNDQWHRELAQLEDAGNYCLLLVPRDEPA